MTEPTPADLERIARRCRMMYAGVADLRARRHTTSITIRMHPDDEPMLRSFDGIAVTRHRTIPREEVWVIDTARTPWACLRVPLLDP